MHKLKGKNVSRHRKSLVIVEVTGGVASVTQKPDDVVVRIMDWDCEGTGWSRQRCRKRNPHPHSYEE